MEFPGQFSVQINIQSHQTVLLIVLNYDLRLRPIIIR
jgi:hypothetical protein